jgi:hypothetical protein
MSYDPDVKVYYLKGDESQDETNRLVPAPLINLSPELYYANDTVIGYTYNITLNGVASAVDLRPSGSKTSSFNNVLEAIKYVKNIFNGNDGTLLVEDKSGQVFKATGCIIRSISFEENDNLWVNYSRYTIVLEANETQIGNCTGAGLITGCDDFPLRFIGNPEGPGSKELVDMRKFKIKSFSDNWTFSLVENIYNNYNFNTSQFRNEHFNVEYTIEAVGKHYFVDNKLLPSWEQAKNFCQFRLKQQIDRLIYNALRITLTDDGCVTDGDSTTIFRSGPPGIIEDKSDLDYEIFNESVSCSTSEGAGSFSLTYNAIIKKVIEDDIFYDSNSVHTINVVKNVSDDGNQKNISYNIEGNIQGLIPGGIIKSSSVLELPSSGNIVITSEPTISKYDNALISYQKIATNKKLNDDFVTALGINNSSLGATGDCIDASGVPRSQSHNVSHSYIEGVISYSSSYDTNTACSANRSFRSIKISVQEPTPIIAEFIVPGRAKGPIVQNIGTKSPRRVSINIEGFQQPDKCCIDFEDVVSNNCEEDISISGIPPVNITGLKLVENNVNISTDGSYSVNRSYICCDL